MAFRIVFASLFFCSFAFAADVGLELVKSSRVCLPVDANAVFVPYASNPVKIEKVEEWVIDGARTAHEISEVDALGVKNHFMYVTETLNADQKQITYVFKTAQAGHHIQELQFTYTDDAKLTITMTPNTQFVPKGSVVTLTCNH